MRIFRIWIYVNMWKIWPKLNLIHSPVLPFLFPFPLHISLSLSLSASRSSNARFTRTEWKLFHLKMGCFLIKSRKEIVIAEFVFFIIYGARVAQPSNKRAKIIKETFNEKNRNRLRRLLKVGHTLWANHHSLPCIWKRRKRQSFWERLKLSVSSINTHHCIQSYECIQAAHFDSTVSLHALNSHFLFFPSISFFYSSLFFGCACNLRTVMT